MTGDDWAIIRISLQQALNVYINWGNDHNLTLNVAKTKAMVICNRHRGGEVNDPAPFNAGNRPIFFVNQFGYLGAILDNDVTMLPEYKAVYRKVEHKIFMLGKL